MKLRKLYMALCGICLAAQSIYAQQNMYVVSDEGSVNAISVSSVNYATFNANAQWFTITNDGIEGATKNSISASCTVSLNSDSEVKSLSFSPEVGVCYSEENALPTVNDGNETLGTELKSYSFSLSLLTLGTTYYFRPYVKLGNAVIYGEVATAKTLGTKPVDHSKTINGHKFIDLGLPSGLLWAETNVGAETETEYGDYFAWGETVANKTDYSWDTYKYGDSSYNITKYNSSDKKTTLDKKDDAAYVKWGRSSCRMPTSDEFEELLNSDNCTWTWTNGGYKVKSLSNGNSIFLPASGYRRGSNLSNQGSHGYYWSSTLNSSYRSSAYYLYFDSSNHFVNDINYRYNGFPVRPVAEP